jgi:hypothetical protein
MSDRLSLRVSYEEGYAERWLAAADDVLAVFEFGRSLLESLDPRHVPVALIRRTTNSSARWTRMPAEIPRIICRATSAARTAD